MCCLPDLLPETGWWTVEQAAEAISTGLAFRMMLEIAPELTFGVLSPAFKGCEAGLRITIKC